MDIYERERKIGKAFLIVYTYYHFINHNETRWKESGSIDTRLNHYKKLSYNDLKIILQKPISNRVKLDNVDISFEELERMHNELSNFFGEVIELEIPIHVEPEKYTINQLLYYLKTINEVNKEVFDEFQLINPEENIEIRAINEGSWKIIVKLIIKFVAGVLAERGINRLIDLFEEKIKAKLSKKNKKNNSDDFNAKDGEHKDE